MGVSFGSKRKIGGLCPYRFLFSCATVSQKASIQSCLKHSRRGGYWSSIKPMYAQWQRFFKMREFCGQRPPQISRWNQFIYKSDCLYGRGKYRLPSKILAYNLVPPTWTGCFKDRCIVETVQYSLKGLYIVNLNITWRYGENFGSY